MQRGYPYTGRMGILQPRDKEIVEEAMARMKVTELSERDFNAISDGQKQRVLVARAIAQDTPVLLLDEPTSYLDLRYRTELMETLKDLAREGRTVLMSLHEIDLALEVSDRILCVQEGQDVWCGSPKGTCSECRERCTKSSSGRLRADSAALMQCRTTLSSPIAAASISPATKGLILKISIAYSATVRSMLWDRTAAGITA